MIVYITVTSHLCCCTEYQHGLIPDCADIQCNNTLGCVIILREMTN